MFLRSPSPIKPDGYRPQPPTNMDLSYDCPESVRSGSTSSLQSNGQSPGSAGSRSTSSLRSNEFGTQSFDDSPGKASFLIVQPSKNLYLWILNVSDIWQYFEVEPMIHMMLLCQWSKFHFVYITWVAKSWRLTESGSLLVRLFRIIQTGAYCRPISSHRHSVRVEGDRQVHQRAQHFGLQSRKPAKNLVNF